MTPTTTAPTVDTVDAYTIRRTVTGAGSHFFAPSTMRFFASRTARHGYRVRVGAVDHLVLVTSERFEYVDPRTGVDRSEPRRWTVRHFEITDHGRQCERADVGAFQEYATAAAAQRAARTFAAALAAA